ncbi:MAG: helix-turn-helix transcriptional regulator [Simplicispira suum]|uniref:ArsR/SmtB family transcription factor n=1 Tax=Simplicispira suum TaxID=2109915 RepID=UPI001C6C30CA|nr:metalloregulator ArsR/SmtB family transcription factor [Simplicispira suum]MBW7833474.1 helix-turn-helix transcriptional regulator [Simplicispira suum]
MKDFAHTARALSALGHEARLSIFHLLVRAGDEGLNVGDMGAHLGIPPTTLGHHLSTLVGVDLVQQERRGREVINRVNYQQMKDLVDFLTSECCAGVSAPKKDLAARSA